MRILVADDDAATRLLICSVLEREGFEVCVAADGLEALARFAERPADIVITDFLMPNMDGLQLCRELRVARGERFVPIVMLTGGREPGLLRDSLEAGALEFLPKPVQAEELVARMRAIASMAAMHNALAASQEETLEEVAIVKHLLERLTRPGLAQMPPCFAMETLQTRRINGDASSYRLGMGGVHFGLLCDATGHGLVAGVSTIPVIETFQAMASRDFPLETIYQEINAKLHRLLPADRFACLIMVRLDPEKGFLRVLNAGMPDVFLLRKEGQALRRFASRHYPAGIQPQPESFQVEDVSVAPGDRLFACSDGLWDLFPEALILKALQGRGTRFPVAQDQAWLQRVLGRSLKNAEQHDDLTWALWEVPPPLPLAGEARPGPAPEGAGAEGLILHFDMDPRVHQVRDLVPHILGMLSFKGVPAPVLQRLGILLVEAINNAVDHGLLGMDPALKPLGFEAFEAQRQAALEAFQGGMARCRLALCYADLRPPLLHRIHIEVSDDGPGFDWEACLRSPAPGGLAPHGRGISLIRALAPDFQYNAAGNGLSFSVPC